MHTWRAECAELQPETSHRVAAWVHRAGASAATHRPPPRRRSACSTASRSAWRSAASATRSSRRCATTWNSSNAPSRAAPRSPCTSRCLSRRHAAARARACNRAHAPAPLRLRLCHRHRTPAPISVAQIAYVSQYLGVDSVVQPHLMWVASAALCDMLAPALPAGWEKARLTMPALTTALLLTMAPPCIARGPRFAMTVLTVGGHALALAPSS